MRASSVLTVVLALATTIVAGTDVSAHRTEDYLQAARIGLEPESAVITLDLHQLLFRNTHLAGHSAYLANALVPESAHVTVTAQRRDRDQTELTIESPRATDAHDR